MAAVEQLQWGAMFYRVEITESYIVSLINLYRSIRSVLFNDLYQETIGLIYSTDLCQASKNTF